MGGGGGGDVGEAFVLGGDDQWWWCCWFSAPVVGAAVAPRGAPAAVEVAVVIQCGGRYIDIRAAERREREVSGRVEKSSFSSRPDSDATLEHI